MKSKLFAVSLFLNVLLLIAACSGPMHSVTNPGPGNVATRFTAFVGGLPGFHGLAQKKTTAFSFSLIPEVHAQVQQTVSFTGSFSGFCPSVTSPAGAANLFFGAGELDGLSCDNSFFINNPDNAATAAANASGAQLVIGDGTIGPLVVYADSSTATVKVFVNRGGQILDTGISATFDGTSKHVLNTATFPVLDGDTIAVVAVSDGNPSRNIQFVLAKQ